MLRYGIEWNVDNPVAVEMALIRSGGSMPYGTKTVGLGLFHHYRELQSLLWPEDDHQLPGDGSVPFDQLAASLRADIPKIFEIHPGIPSEVIPGRLVPLIKKLSTTP